MITTYLHKPLGVQNPPLVIWCGGVDQYKANHWRPIQDMLAKGFAVATLDLPAFGESRQWPPDTKAEEAWRRMGGEIGILESFVDFACEVSVIVARGRNGAWATYPPVENKHLFG